ncbi:MAG: HIT domain-containing protein [Patescibacteria group bacterium]|jgi:histidine triad (HIT) family protein
MQNESCLFCQIANHTIPSQIFYEDEKTVAFLDIAAVSKGHTLIIPKNHAENLSANSEEDAVAIMRTLWKIAPVILKTLGATGYNLGMNNGKDAGQEVMHTHLHVMPRYQGIERSFKRLSPADFELADVAKELQAAFKNL